LVVASIASREVAIRRRNMSRSTRLATVTYFDSGYKTHVLTKARVFCKPVDHRGIGLVLRCRLGSYPTAQLLVEIQRLPPYFRNKCPFCRGREPETLYHLFFKCHAWNRQRRKSGIMGTIGALRTLNADWAELRTAQPVLADSLGMSALSDEALAVSWILGGNHGTKWGVSGYMPRPPSPQQAEDDPPDGASSSSSDEETAVGRRNRIERRVHLLKVGMFLTLIAPSRRRRIGPPTGPTIQIRLRGGHGPGAPTSSTGQSLVR
jgi:hypothetical protein